ncbi:hypothetical protein VNI00_006534 [Paramarasmius palmivorus]|uniref:RRM domain-containing protein n=1 Tax=Paramarasmius palmivorus TaxID=297713 RepID=A0AAW0D771_9AGAR
MARNEGYDYPPGLGHGGLDRFWDTGEEFTPGPNSHGVTSPPPTSSSSTSTTLADTSSSSSSIGLQTLFWGDLEPWMDEEYVKQVCTLMGWDPQVIKVPPPTGSNANNSGFCLLTFRSPAHASQVLAQINSSATPPTMPNSTKPFQMNWASSIQLPTSALSPTYPPNSIQSQLQSQQQYPQEYSIFVGDLAPETSNSDLVAVFRNPVLGLRNDREPKFIRPFLSCKSAKIMLDPITGVSRGYGFVRFTDEADQQRALIEMHGLYCLSRPMRISPATAKFKPPPAPLPAPHTYAPPFHVNPTPSMAEPPSTFTPTSTHATTGTNQPKSVSSPIASSAIPVLSGTGSDWVSNGSTSPGAGGTGSSSSNGSLASTATAFSSGSSDSDVKLLAQLAQQYTNTHTNGAVPKFDAMPDNSQPSQNGDWSNSRYALSEESWKHHAQARAILGNLIGPNGEQLTSTDPYNTTVFVGGLSPLINEDTLRTFFAPFGDIHYVKVPVGKNCGFVQFVRKADAEHAIEKMQGFPIGGSRIRLSWGRSQYKAAQAAAQAAQAAAMQLQNSFGVTPPLNSASSNPTPSAASIHPLLQAFQPPNAPPAPQHPMPSHNLTQQHVPQGPLTGMNLNSLSQDQAIQLLQKLAAGGYMDVPVAADKEQHGRQMGAHSSGFDQHQYGNGQGQQANPQQLASAGLYAEEKLRTAHLASREDVVGNHHGARNGVSAAGGLYDHGLFGHAFSSSTGNGSLQDDIPQRSHSQPRNAQSMMAFSPFSPDPNGAAAKAELTRRESIVSNASSVGDNGHRPLIALNGLMNGHGSATSALKMSPTSTRPGSGLSRYGSYSGQNPANLSVGSPVSAASGGRHGASGASASVVISRPSSGQHYHQQHHQQPLQQQTPSESFDSMHDLNGTLASLDLDSASGSPHPQDAQSPPLPSNARRSSQLYAHAWRSGLKSPTGGSESGSSGQESVQFQLTRRGDADRDALRAVSPM